MRKLFNGEKRNSSYRGDNLVTKGYDKLKYCQ